MAQPFIGEIRMFAGNFAPAGWAFCNGALLAIAENDALFTLLGTTFGGDGEETFGLPNLGGRLPVHQGTGPGLSTRTRGEMGGTLEVTLTTQQMPNHTHAFVASAAPGTSGTAQNQLVAQGTNIQLFRSINPSINFAPTVVSPAGGSQPHDNRMQYLSVNFIISLYGIFPRFS